LCCQVRRVQRVTLRVACGSSHLIGIKYYFIPWPS
jgi:hypothetical protein